MCYMEISVRYLLSFKLKEKNYSIWSSLDKTRRKISKKLKMQHNFNRNFYILQDVRNLLWRFEKRIFWFWANISGYCTYFIPIIYYYYIYIYWIYYFWWTCYENNYLVIYFPLPESVHKSFKLKNIFHHYFLY